LAAAGFAAVAGGVDAAGGPTMFPGQVEAEALAAFSGCTPSGGFGDIRNMAGSRSGGLPGIAQPQAPPRHAAAATASAIARRTLTFHMANPSARPRLTPDEHEG
jgi:hypothetical protein